MDFAYLFFLCIVFPTMSSRMRVTKGRRNNRRSHHGVPKVTLTTEGDTKVPHIRHRANPVTGTYRGRKVIDVDSKVAKKAAKKADTKADAKKTEKASVEKEKKEKKEKK